MPLPSSIKATWNVNVFSRERCMTNTIDVGSQPRPDQHILAIWVLLATTLNSLMGGFVLSANHPIGTIFCIEINGMLTVEKRLYIYSAVIQLSISALPLFFCLYISVSLFLSLLRLHPFHYQVVAVSVSLRLCILVYVHLSTLPIYIYRYLNLSLSICNSVTFGKAFPTSLLYMFSRTFQWGEY